MSESANCVPCFSREKVAADDTAPPPAAESPTKKADAPSKPEAEAATDGEAEAEETNGTGEALTASQHFSRIVTFVKGSMSLSDSLTEPLIEKEEEKPADVVCAAWIIEDALDGHCADDYPEGDEAKALRKRVDRLYYMKKIIFYTTCLLVCMLFVEVPLWCTPVSSSQDTKWEAKEYCPLKGADGSPLGHSDYSHVMFSSFVLPPKYGMILEAVCYLFLTSALFFELQLSKDLGPSRRLSNCMPGRFLMVMALMWIDLIVYFYFWDKDAFSPVRFAPYGRLILLFYGDRVRAVFSSCWGCLDEFGSVCIFLMGSVVFFAWMLFNIFDDIRDIKEEQGHKGLTAGDIAGDPDLFGSFRLTLVTFFTIMTGAAFPDDATTVMKKSHWYALIFYPFMVLSFFLFTQLMLAVVYNAYSGETEDKLKEFYVNRSKALTKSFSVLSVENDEGTQVLKVDTFSALVETLSSWPRFKGRLRQQDSEVLFQALDDDQSGQLTMDEFFDACSTLQYTIWSTPYKSWIMRQGKLPGLGKIEKFVQDGGLDIATEAVLIANAIFIVVQSWYDFNNKVEPSVFPAIEFFFSVIYMVEVAFKLTVMSFPYYWAHTSNKFDFFVSWVLFIGGTLDFFEIRTGLPLDQLMQYFNILRVLRLLRLLTQVPKLKKMCVCIGKLCQVSGDMAILFIISTVFLAVIGVQVFGGLLYPNAPKITADDPDDVIDFVDAGFDVLNFNDMTGAFFALFDMMVCAYQPEYAEAMDLVLPIEIFGYTIDCIGEIYCGLVFFLSVNIAFNIFTAFVIDIFVSLEESMEEGEETEEDRNLKSMKCKFEERGEVLHFLEPPEVLRLRTLTGVIDGLDDAIQDAKDEALGITKDDDEEEEVDESALQSLAEETLGSFRAAEYVSNLVTKLQNESIKQPSDLLIVSKEAMEEKLASHGGFKFVELADSMRLREAAEKAAAESA